MRHLACIMDGNRRWAKEHGLRSVGRDGIDAAHRAVDFCLDHGILYLSLFAFSLENFKRAPYQVAPLFDLMVQEIQAKKDMFIKKGVRVQFIGDRALFPKHILHACIDLEKETRSGTALHVFLLFCYGARQEIVDATQRIVHDVQSGVIKNDAITPALFEKYLWTTGTPDPDLIIRTGNTQRLSNFLLYQAAYTELYFTEKLWPAMMEDDFAAAYTYFKQCKRNFGT